MRYPWQPPTPLVLGSLLSLGLALLLAACGPSAAPNTVPAAAGGAPAALSGATSAQAPSGGSVEVVHATWANHPQILADAFAKFERETGIKVQPSVGSTGDRLTRLYAEKGNPSIDVAAVTPSDALRLLEAGVIEPPNPDLPNMKNLVAAAHHPAGYVTSMLAIGLGYNPQYGVPTSWNDLWDPKYKGKVALSGWPGSPATVQLVMAARLNGGSDDNLDPGFAALQKLLPAKFFPQGPSAEPFYVQGDVWIHPAIHGAVLQMKDKDVPIDWVAPKEGAAADFNVLVIPKGVKNKAAAEKFVDFFLGPDVQVAYAVGLFYAPVNQTVQLPPDVAAKVHPTVEEQRNLQAIPWEKISAHESELSDRWNREIAGR
jgi:putative spermidine/putrescine transport system substrate-binding protein